MKPVDASLIELLVAPAVLLPACGLLVLSTSARLSAILARLRDLHRERINLYLQDRPGDDAHQRVIVQRLECLETQTHQMLRRAGRTRNALQLLYTAILLLLVSSGVLGVSAAFPSIQLAAVVIFGLALLALAIAVLFAMFDVADALTGARIEHELTESLTQDA